jgi:hypothetical protein
MTPRTALLILLILASSSIAGCAGKGSGDGAAAQATLDAGKGAIQGAVFDDILRPIPAATVLLKELGLTTSTDEQGQFSFLNLDPASYTLLAQADAHEAAPTVVDVTAAQYAEPEIIARRLFSDAGSIITTAYTIFIPCAADYVVDGRVADCTLDQSGDSFRPDFVNNYRPYGANATFVVSEMLANKPDRYEIQMRGSDSKCGYLAVDDIDGSYSKMVLEYGTANTVNVNLAYGANEKWTNQCSIDTILFSDSQGREELQGVPVAGSLVCCGVGVHFGMRGNFIQSLFLGTPSVNVATYHVLNDPNPS